MAQLATLAGLMVSTLTSASLAIVVAATTASGVIATGRPSLTNGDGGCEITAHGAVPGNRSEDARANALAVQSALRLCDLVRVPKGTFKIAPVVLPSHRTLWLDDGASLVGSDVWQVCLCGS